MMVRVTGLRCRRGAEDAASKLAALDARVRAADGELAGA